MGMVPALKNGHQFELTGMNSKLNHFQNWPEMAREAKWSASELAKKCGISVRTLERHFLNNMDACPKKWLIEQRQKRASELLCAGSTVKEASYQIGYRHASTFSREYKKHCGSFPTEKHPSKVA